ncbi:stage II sporulation protein M [Planctomicrobium sp. SH664]|uniref:stage II sporulation protein M n=1 Tax=Planctomicrobium sp. SH664 TaxID=3448125 RepID=UPI003F5B7E6C
MSSFISRNKADWEELEYLIKLARKSLRKLGPEELDRLDQLYRRATIHLSRVTTASHDQQLATYLNNLTAAAHSLIYLPPRESVAREVVRFVTEGFSRAVARNGRAHLISLLLLLGGGLIGYFAAMSHPLVAHALWPAHDPRQPGSSPEQLLEVLRGGREQGGGVKFLFASFLFQHNFKVGVLAFASGFLAAVPTVFLMLLNGMLLGVFAAIHHKVGIVSEMWAWILPHGITEMGAIVLCGGMGLMLGRAVVCPGILTRRQALVDTGWEAAKICLGCGGMLFLAAIIESYVRQSHLTTAARFWFAAATAIFWALYFWNGYRRERLAQTNRPGSGLSVRGEVTG